MDFIASMASGLLGCINGSDWLSSVKSGIQECSYFEKTALKPSTSQTESIQVLSPSKERHKRNRPMMLYLHPNRTK
jgi:hypothetical protein